MLAWCLTGTGGQFFYTLDDPYIHLAVAENILRGGYGVNLGEYSSPSSSILWPFLIALTLLLGLGDWGPLVVNVLAMSVTVWILSGALQINCFGEQLPGREHWWLLLAPLLLLAINAFALPFTGMEHSLHVMASVLVIAGLVQCDRSGLVPWWLLVGIVLGPLVRFEGAALSAAAIGLLAWRGWHKSAVVLGASLFLLIGAWVGVALSHGLPPLPSSVLVKSGISATALDGDYQSLFKSISVNVHDSLHNYWGLLFLVSGALLVVHLLQTNSESQRAFVMTVVAAIVVLFAHVLGGKYGWFGRYEVYVVATLVLAMLFVHGERIREVRPVSRRVITLSLFIFTIAVGYFDVLYKTPKASKNIYEQQYQMHRFATEYFSGRNVAVNDLGWVAYKNDSYVLDLWGLGSEKVRRLREGANGMLRGTHSDVLAREHGVIYAMIYDSWFSGDIPSSWCRVAVLHTSRITAADAEVAFYLVDLSAESEMRDALDRWSSSLPYGASVRTLSCNMS